MCAELLFDYSVVICHRDACIQQWMRTSLSGWRLGIRMKILSARPLASSVGYGFGDDAAAEAERDDAIIAQLPDLSFWVPRPAGLLHQLADCHVGEGDA